MHVTGHSERWKLYSAYRPFTADKYMATRILWNFFTLTEWKWITKPIHPIQKNFLKWGEALKGYIRWTFRFKISRPLLCPCINSGRLAKCPTYKFLVLQKYKTKTLSFETSKHPKHCGTRLAQIFHLLNIIVHYDATIIEINPTVLCKVHHKYMNNCTSKEKLTKGNTCTVLHFSKCISLKIYYLQWLR